MRSTTSFDGYDPTWCPGCGDWAIGAAIKKALTDLGTDPSGIFVVFGIGCSGNMNDFLNAYAIHSLHGRAIPNAIGMKLANHKMPVLAVVGDGDCYGEGGNHFMHSCRGNHDITVLVHDNNVYGLTTGQVAPTAPKGFQSKSTPKGIIEVPINPLTLSISQGATFVAQAFAGDVVGVINLIKDGITHKGFSLINVLQPCVTFNKINTYEYYRDKTYYLDNNHDKTNFEQAMIRAMEPTYSEKFPLGVIYQINRPTFDEQIPALSAKALVDKEPFDNLEVLINDFI